MKKSLLRMLLGLWAVLLLVVGHHLIKMDFPITDFSQGVLGMAAQKDVEISKVIRYYYGFILVGIPILAYGIKHSFPYLPVLAGRWRDRLEIRVSSKKDFVCYAAVLLCAMLAGNHELFGLLMAGIFMVGLCGFFYFGYARHGKEELAGMYVIWVFMVLTAAVLVMLPLVLVGETAGVLAVTMVAGGLWYSVYNLCNARGGIARLGYALLPVLFLPFFVWLSIEILYTLKVYGVAVSFWPLVLLYVVMFIWMWRRWHGWDGEHPYRHFYELATISLVFLGNIRQLETSHGVDFFEGSNHGRAIFDWINGYGLPLLDNFDAHMLSGTIAGYLYYLINGDVYGAIFAPYAYIQNVIALVGFFFIIKLLIGARDAFLFVALFPLMAWSFWSIGFILFAYWLYWVNHRNITTDILLAVLFIGSFLYRLDFGVSFGLALVVISFAYLLVHRCYREAGRLLGIGLLSGTIFCLSVYLLGQQQGIIWSYWLQEFLQECTSNQNWAYGVLGNRHSVEILYFIVPVVAGILFVYLSRKKDELFFYGMIFLLVAHLMNIPRTLVRHSMIENSVMAYGLPILIVSLLLAGSMRKGKRIVLVVLFFILPVVVTRVNPWPVAPFYQCTAQALLSIESDQRTAVIPKKDDQQLIDEVRCFLRDNAQQDETYLDFTNQSLMYAFVDKRHPVYPNQSPGMVNAEKGQQMFLQDASNFNLPFVFMPYVNQVESRHSCFYVLDAILNTDRYYHILEYIGTNYRPLCRVGDFAVWCRVEDYERLRPQVESQGWDLLPRYDYNIDKYHEHNLGAIPFLWGQYGKKKTEDLTVLAEIDLMERKQGVYQLPSLSVAAPCYLVLEIETDAKRQVGMTLSGAGLAQQAKYSFELRPGKHYYRFRVSTDILWYSGALDTLKLEVVDAKVLRAFYAEPEKVDEVK